MGSAKSATDYVTVTSYIINYIRRTYKKRGDVAGALEEFKEVDFTSVKPTVRAFPRKTRVPTQTTLMNKILAQLKLSENLMSTTRSTRDELCSTRTTRSVKAAVLLFEQCSLTT